MVNGRVLYLSRIKALACIAVVVLHTFFTAANFAAVPYQLRTMSAVRNCMMWAVPCFVMASGALLLNSKRVLTPKKLFGKYFLRMVFALIVFSVLFSVFDAFTTAHYTPFETLKDTFSDIFLGTGWPHMWYIYLMMAIYLLLPFYKIICDHASASQIKYLLLLYSIFLSLIPFIETISGKKLPFYICVFSIYPLYLFFGHALHTGIIRLPKNASGIMFLICTGITAMLTVYAMSVEKSSPEASKRMISFLSVYSFPIYAAASIGAFAYIRKTRNSPVPIFDTIASELDNCSFGIYLLHMAVLKFIFAVLKFNPFEHGGTITIIGICIITLVISYALTRLLRLVPCIKKII